MSAKLRWPSLLCLLTVLSWSFFSPAFASLTTDAIARQLGWVSASANNCGGYYLEEPLPPSLLPENSKAVGVTSEGGFLAQHSTSVLEGNVTVRRAGQQITANRAYLYRDPVNGKLIAIDMIGDVHLREAHSLIVGKKGRYNFKTTAKSLSDISYRTSLDPRHTMTQQSVQTVSSTDRTRTANLTAFGVASEFSQMEPRVYEMYNASYSTCPPINPAWLVRASHIVLNKNTGRGYATNATVLVQNVPVFYMPYINFPIDKRRKSGFLWPTAGNSNKWGPYIQTPFYWNMAPNYDMTFSPGYLSWRGVLLTDEFRYLSNIGYGDIRLSILPHDKAFRNFQESAANDSKYTNPVLTGQTPPSVTKAELSRLLNASDTRKSFLYRDDSRFNENWSSHIDLNMVSDDYYLQDFGRTVNEISENQILQEGDLYYKSPHWNFTGRLQAYQTLHAINAAMVINEYQRMPQLMLNGDYPDQIFGLEFFIINEATRFDKRKTPGVFKMPPVGNRFNVQPGVSLPLYWPYFYINPRLQVALTAYDLQRHPIPPGTPIPPLLLDDHISSEFPDTIKRSIPIFDIVSGLNFTRDISFFRHGYTQTLEPQFYYVYIPYHNQSRIPIFDTTVNMLTYDQIFNYNRFTGIDRIGDANQLGFGVTTRWIDQDTGEEKVRAGVGSIWYFSHRKVTLCNTPGCSDNPGNSSNDQGLSPISGLLQYHINPAWSFNSAFIWNPIWKQLDNGTVAFQFAPDNQRLINLGYTYARNGDVLSGVQTNESINNLKVTDFSFAWPITNNFSVVGRWSESWNIIQLQNLVYGLQYDTCCWAVRIIGGKAFAGLDPLKNNRPKYTEDFSIQISFKGLGDIGRKPAGLLSGIPGYKTQFGQEL